MPNQAHSAKIIAKMSEASALQTMIAASAAMNAGLPWPTVVAMSCGGIIGATQTCAALVGQGDTDAHGVTSDTMLFVMLLAYASVEVKHVADNANAVENSFDQDNTTYITAMGLFEKLTGRKIDSALKPDVVAHAHIGAKDAAELLSRVCANRRPA